MGQKTSPIGFRTGITRDWQSTWYASKADYGTFLVEDQKIREYADKRYNRRMPKGAVSRIEIVRTRNEVKVTLRSARPGVVIGPRGGEVDKFREELELLTGRKVNVNVIEIKEPDLDATLVAASIAEQLCKRASFRRTMKQYCELAMNARSKGVKIICSGRLAGSEMARRETQKLGSIPLHTLDANVDYGVATARTTYGAVGVKVWIYKGKFGEEEETRHQPRGRAPRRSVGQQRSSKRTAARPGSAPRRKAARTQALDSKPVTKSEAPAAQRQEAAPTEPQSPEQS